MNKKFLFISLIAFVLSIFLLHSQALAADKSNGTIKYVDPQHRFTLQLPSRWAGKYFVKEENLDGLLYIEFKSKAVTKRDPLQGRFFGISIYNKDCGNMEAIGEYLIGSKAGKYYYFNMPTDVQCCFRDLSKEFYSLEKDLNFILKSVKL